MADSFEFNFTVEQVRVLVPKAIGGPDPCFGKAAGPPYPGRSHRFGGLGNGGSGPKGD